jgi:uncharacterized protein
VNTFFLAVGLVFVLEGLLPFLAPKLWRRIMYQVMMKNDRALRVFGFISMMIGLVLVYILQLM